MTCFFCAVAGFMLGVLVTSLMVACKRGDDDLTYHD